MPCTILKSDWLCHHVLIVLVVLGANHVMCFLTSVCYFPWLVFRLHCITVHFIAFRLRSTLAFRLHCKTISGEVMLCCLLSSLGLQVFSTWILNCICVKFFRVFFQFVFEIKLQSNQIWWVADDFIFMVWWLWSVADSFDRFVALRPGGVAVLLSF